MPVEYIVQCDICNKEVRQSGEPETKFLPAGDPVQTCKPCGKKVDELNRPAREKQEAEDAILAEAMKERLAAEEAAKKEQENQAQAGLAQLAQSMDVLAKGMAALIQQNQDIMAHLIVKEAKEVNGKKAATSRAKRR